MEEEEENQTNENVAVNEEEEEEEVAEDKKVEIPPERRIPMEIFRKESVDNKLDSQIGTFLAIGAIKRMGFGIPSCCTVKDILFTVDEVKNEEPFFNEETFVSFFDQCLKAIKSEFMLMEEEEDDEDEDKFELTKDFIQERLSDLQQVEDSDFCFTFTSFCVQEAEISDLSLLTEFDSLTTISLKNNKIKNLEPLEKMPRLKNLDLTENNIKSTKSLSFPVLEKLNLSKNKITYIGSCDMPKLKQLNFSENKIFFIAPSAFSKCSSLEVLDISINSLRKIREGAFEGLKELKKLKLNENSLTSILGAFSKDLTSLKEVDLSENPLESALGIQFVTSLEKCFLHKTQLETVDSVSSMSSLSNMKNLTIYESPLAEVEDIRLEVIHLMPSLEEIDEQPVSVNEKQDSKNLFIERAEEEKRLLEEKLAAEAAARAEEEAAALAAAEEEEGLDEKAKTEGETIYSETGDSAQTV